MIFDVADICHRIAYFKIYFVRAVEYTVEDGFEFGVNVNINSVKSLEKFFPTRTYYYIRALLSILFIKVFLLDTEQT